MYKLERKNGKSISCADENIHNQADEFVKIRYEKVNLPFIILLLGSVVAILAIIVEQLYWKTKDNGIALSVDLAPSLGACQQHPSCKTKTVSVGSRKLFHVHQHWSLHSKEKNIAMK